jgi:hypothetical protein
MFRGAESMPSIAARSGADTAPLVRRKRVDGRTKAARRVRQLLADYERRLHLIDIRLNPAVYATALKLAEMETLAEEHRGAALRHEPVDLAGLIRLENAARRLKVDLGLEGPPPPPPPPSLDEYVHAKYEVSR